VPPFSKNSGDERRKALGNADGFAVTTADSFFMILNAVGITEVNLVDSAVVVSRSFAMLVTENLYYLLLLLAYQQVTIQ